MPDHRWVENVAILIMVDVVTFLLVFLAGNLMRPAQPTFSYLLMAGMLVCALWHMIYAFVEKKQRGNRNMIPFKILMGGIGIIFLVMAIIFQQVT